MEAFYPWIVFIHVVGGFVFVLGHGAAASMAIQLRQERELERVRALLDLSRNATGGLYLGLILLLFAGVAAGFVGGHWGRGWIWTALVILVALLVYMYLRASSYYAEARRLAGLEYFRNRPYPAEAPRPAELHALLQSTRPIELGAVGGLGLLAILWLMFFKPF
jgi:hypothetical protein